MPRVSYPLCNSCMLIKKTKTEPLIQLFTQIRETREKVPGRTSSTVQLMAKLLLAFHRMLSSGTVHQFPNHH